VRPWTGPAKEPAPTAGQRRAWPAMRGKPGLRQEPPGRRCPLGRHRHHPALGSTGRPLPPAAPGKRSFEKRSPLRPEKAAAPCPPGPSPGGAPDKNGRRLGTTPPPVSMGGGIKRVKTTAVCRVFGDLPNKKPPPCREPPVLNWIPTGGCPLNCFRGPRQGGATPQLKSRLPLNVC